jgi:hypothetical protein
MTTLIVGLMLILRVVLPLILLVGIGTWLKRENAY